MTTPLASGSPTPIYIYLDGDGTIYPDLALYLALGYKIPELGYDPQITGEELNQAYVTVQQQIKAQSVETGETYTGVDVVNGLTCYFANAGQLKGLNNAVIREVGRRHVKLHDGVVEFMRDAREIARKMSSGRVDVRFVINSSNLREGLLGSELGTLSQGPDPLVSQITGQSFYEMNGVIAFSQRTFLGESKADVVNAHIRNGVVDPRNVIVVADGMTDRMLFAANQAGMNVLVNDARDPDRFQEFSEFVSAEGNMRGPIATDWRPRRSSGDSYGLLYLTLMSQVRTLTGNIMRLQNERPPADSRIRLGTYSDPKRSEFRELLAKMPSSNEKITVHNGESAWTSDTRVSAVIRAAARSKAKVAVDPRTARQLFTGSYEDCAHSFSLVIPSKGSNDHSVVRMLAALSRTPPESIHLPDVGSKGFNTEVGRIAIRRATPEQSAFFDSLAGEVSTGSHAGFEVRGHTVAFWVPNTIIERSLQPAISARSSASLAASR